MNTVALKNKALLVKNKTVVLTNKAQERVHPYRLSSLSMIAGAVAFLIGFLTWGGISLLGLLIVGIGFGFSCKEGNERERLKALAAKENEAVDAPETEVGHG